MVESARSQFSLFDSASDDVESWSVLSLIVFNRTVEVKYDNSNVCSVEQLNKDTWCLFDLLEHTSDCL